MVELRIGVSVSRYTHFPFVVQSVMSFASNLFYTPPLMQSSIALLCQGHFLKSVLWLTVGCFLINQLVHLQQAA